MLWCYSYVSTAVAALAGVQCSFPPKLARALLSDENQDQDDREHDDNGLNIDDNGGKARVVLLGGGEYACVFANASYAMDSLGADGSLVTSTRPMSLKDTPLVRDPCRSRILHWIRWEISSGTCTCVYGDTVLYSFIVCMNSKQTLLSLQYILYGILICTSLLKLITFILSRLY